MPIDCSSARHGSCSLCAASFLLLAAAHASADSAAAPNSALGRSYLTLTLDDDQPAAQPTPQQETSPPLNPPSFPATGNWGGLRPQLADKGITFGGSILLDTSRNFTGGLSHNKTAVRYLLDANVTIDMEKALGVHGGTLYVDFQNHDGPNASLTQIGDVQGFDNMDASHYSQIYQFWYQQLLVGDKVRIKVGKIDSNADFYVVDHGKDFLNSSMAYSISMFPFVTYPDPAPGGELFINPDKHFYAGLGAFYSNRHQRFLDISGHPEEIERSQGGTFLIGEMGYRWTLGKDALAGHAAVGGWGHTGMFPNLRAGVSDGTAGSYGYADQSIFHQESKGSPTRDVGLFLQYGWADPVVSPVAQHIGGGVACVGLVPNRPQDVIGLGPSWVKLGDIPNAVHGYEFSVEAFYKLQITPWFDLKPDLQYIRHPGGLAIEDALVGTLRVEVDF